MSAIGLTMIITAVVTQLSILVFGFIHLDHEFNIKISYSNIVEGGVTAAAVLIRQNHV